MHRCDCRRGLSAILLLLVWVVLALPVSSAQSTEPTADTLEVQDLGGLEEGLALLTAGKLEEAGGLFLDAEKTDRHPLAGVLAHLAAAYRIYQDGDGPPSRPHSELGQAVEAAKREQPSQADYGALLRWTRKRLVDQESVLVPPWGRVLYCHLRLLKEAALADPPEVDLNPVSFRATDRIQAPQRLFDPPGPYTAEARRARVEGLIVVEATIDSDGCTRDTRVLKSLDPGIDRNAETAMRWWVSRPATREGEQIAVSFNWTLRYGLR